MPIAAKTAKGAIRPSRTPSTTVAKPAAKTKEVKAPAKAAAVAKTSPKAVQRRPAAKAVGAPAAATRKRRLPEVDSDQRQHYVEVAAYYIAERRGFLGGCESEDWIQAEREIDRLLQEGKLTV
ncbi:MAG TPA: DUF2934 domain-containing protein [Rhodocyclaceae bacterium]|nr:DUF2934 domain-containing protein [Rhodocyclaceae bacterium]